jgi:hypothetical protein
MTTSAITTVVAGTLLTSAALYRYTRIRDPIGFGYNSFSPDRRYRAFATTFHGVSFFGRRRAFYKFEVEDCEAHRTIALQRTPWMAEDEAEDLSEPCISWWWEPDARRVRVAIGDRTYWEYDFGPDNTLPRKAASRHGGSQRGSWPPSLNSRR